MTTATPDTDDEFARALDAALGGGSNVLLDGQRQNLQGGWATGRQGHFNDPTRARSSAFDEEGRYQLTDISHTHEAIMNFMIAAPQLPLRDVAAHFGYTQAWLSTLIHSDLFQARLREKQGLVMSGIAEDLTAKLKAVADVGIEKIAQQLETSEDPRFLLESTKLALTHLGFGAKPAAGAVNVNAQNVQQVFVASAADLEAARGRILSGGNAGGVGSVPPQVPQVPGPAQSEATLNSLPLEEPRTLEGVQSQPNLEQ